MIDVNIMLAALVFPDKSTVKPKTCDPVWNESFIHELENANSLCITIFHDAPISDVFVANCIITFDDLIARQEQEQQDFWVSSALLTKYCFLLTGLNFSSRLTWNHKAVCTSERT
jgi:Ca2+-dependent lipid-binding protein